MLNVSLSWKLRSSINWESLITPSVKNGMVLISTAEKCEHNISLLQVSVQDGVKARWALAFI